MPLVYGNLNLMPRRENGEVQRIGNDDETLIKILPYILKCHY